MHCNSAKQLEILLVSIFWKSYIIHFLLYNWDIDGCGYKILFSKLTKTRPDLSKLLQNLLSCQQSFQLAVLKLANTQCQQVFGTKYFAQNKTCLKILISKWIRRSVGKVKFYIALKVCDYQFKANQRWANHSLFELLRPNIFKYSFSHTNIFVSLHSKIFSNPIIFIFVFGWYFQTECIHIHIFLFYYIRIIFDFQGSTES